MRVCVLVRDLPKTCPACLLDRLFPENLHFGQAKKNSLQNFNFDFLGVINKYLYL